MRNKVLLVLPPYTDRPVKITPNALLRVSSLLVEDGYKVKIFNGTYNPNYVADLLTEIDETTLCVGITCMTGPQILNALTTCKEVRIKDLKIPIVWGGWHASILPEQTMQSEYVDFVIRGQGERSFHSLVKALQGDGSYSTIKGLSYKENGENIHNPDRFLEDISNFPMTPYHIGNIKETIEETSYGPTIHYTTSQGCPFRCSFCADPVVNKRRWGGYTVGRVISELKLLSENYGVKNFTFDDTLFFISKKRTEEFCRKVLENELNISWNTANGRVAQLVKYGDDLWGLIRDAGCKSISIGAESALQEVLDEIQKDAEADQLFVLNDIAARFKIKICFNTMIGIPMEGNKKISLKAELKAMLKLYYRLLSRDTKHQVKLFFYTPFPGTPLYSQAVRNGFNSPKTLEEWGDFRLECVRMPWVDRHFQVWVDSVRMFIVPFYQGRSVTRKSGRGRGIYNLCLDILSFLAGLRLKYQFYRIPVEYLIIKKVLKQRGFELDY